MIAKLFRPVWVRLLLITIIFLACSGAIAWLVWDGMTIGRQSLKQFYATELNLLSQKAQTTGFSRRGEEQLHQLLDRALQSQLDIDYAYVLRGHDQYIHTFDGGFPEDLISDKPALSDRISIVKTRIGEQDFYEFARLYALSVPTSIHIGVSTEKIDQPSMENSAIQSIIFGIVAVVAAMGAMFVIWIAPREESEIVKPKNISTQRKKGQEELHWREMFRSSPSAMILYQAETGEVRAANGAMCNLLGYSEKILQGNNISNFMVASDDESVPLNMVEDAEPENTVYLKTARKGMIPLHAEAQQFYIGSELYQLVAGFDVSELLQHQQSLRSERNVQSTRATTDQLTKLFNRQGIKSHADAELNRAERGAPLSLILLDIDKFKIVNDTFGHDAGDRVLVKIAEIMNNTKRPYDWAGRWGGEEFMILLPGTKLSEAVVVAERLRSNIESTVIHIARGKDHQVTVSLGVASTEKDSCNSCILDKLVKAADEGLYKAKQTGRNRTCVFREGKLQKADI